MMRSAPLLFEEATNAGGVRLLRDRRFYRNLQGPESRTPQEADRRQQAM